VPLIDDDVHAHTLRPLQTAGAELGEFDLGQRDPGEMVPIRAVSLEGGT
jgi:hypothetical protein